MDQLVNNIQAALAALRAAKPDPTQWSGPAATALTHRIDLLEIEFTVLCTLLSAATIKGIFNGGGSGLPIGKVPGFGTPVVPLEQMVAQLGLHLL